MKKPLIGILTTIGLLSFGVACSQTASYDSYIPEDEEYIFNTDMPFYSTPDAFMTLDGKFDETQWNDCVWLETNNVEKQSKFKLTTTFTMEGLYVGMICYSSDIVWDSQHNYPANTHFVVEIAKEDERHWGANSNHPLRDVSFRIDAKNSLSLRETQYACGSYVEGDKVQLFAVSQPGYRFVGWYQGENLVFEGSVYEFTAEDNGEYVAKFEPYSKWEDSSDPILPPDSSVSSSENSSTVSSEAPVQESSGCQSAQTPGTALLGALACLAVFKKKKRA
jgi:hypothetical protein